jgi:SH3 domain-containing YSC84-like protein 1
MKRIIQFSVLLFTLATLIGLPIQAFAVDMIDSPRVYHTKSGAADYKNYMQPHSTPHQVQQYTPDMIDSPRVFHTDSGSAAYKHYMASQPSMPGQMSMATPKDPDQTVRFASRIFKDAAMKTSEAIPAPVIDNAAGIAIFPNRPRVTPTGGTYRSGVLLSRQDNGKWSSPVFVSLASGMSRSKQKAASSGVVLIFNDRNALNKIAKSDNFTLGEDATLAKGNTGSNVSAAEPNKEVLAYRVSDGHFSGVSLMGSVLNIETAPTIAYYNLSEGQAGANGYYSSSGEGIFNKIIGSTDSAERIERHPASADQLRQAIRDYASQVNQHSAM